MSQEQDSGLEQKNEGKKKRRKKEDKDLELHSVGALPDVLTALDACLQEEMGKEGSSGIQAQELLSRMTRACQTGHHDESPQHTLSTTKIVAFGKSGHETDQKGHGEHLTDSHVEKSSGPMDSVVFLRAEAIPEHELKVSSIGVSLSMWVIQGSAEFDPSFNLVCQQLAQMLESSLPSKERKSIDLWMEARV